MTDHRYDCIDIRTSEHQQSAGLYAPNVIDSRPLGAVKVTVRVCLINVASSVQAITDGSYIEDLTKMYIKLWLQITT